MMSCKPKRSYSWYICAFLSAILYLVGAIEVGVAYLPFFACLSTPHRALGGALGLLYTLMWYKKKTTHTHTVDKSLIW